MNLAKTMRSPRKSSRVADSKVHSSNRFRQYFMPKLGPLYSYEDDSHVTVESPGCGLAMSNVRDSGRSLKSNKELGLNLAPQIKSSLADPNKSVSATPISLKNRIQHNSSSEVSANGGLDAQVTQAQLVLKDTTIVMEANKPLASMVTVYDTIPSAQRGDMGIPSLNVQNSKKQEQKNDAYTICSAKAVTDSLFAEGSPGIQNTTKGRCLPKSIYPSISDSKNSDHERALPKVSSLSVIIRKLPIMIRIFRINP